jgi:triacylglycerol lipase
MTASRSRHLVDPAFVEFLDLVPHTVLSDESLPMMRSFSMKSPATAEDLERVEVTTRMIPGPADAPEVELLVFRPRNAGGARPCIFHIHGGGFVSGVAQQFDGPLCEWAVTLDCVVTSVNYRLAPETRFPGAIEDCYAALTWVLANAADLGVDATRIGVKGESSGGGIAAALALLARDRGEHRLAFQSLAYPMLDDRTCVRDANPYAGEFLWTAPHNAYGWRSLLGVEPGAADASAYAAPARAEDLSGLPPTFLITGALDLFVDEIIEYARRLIRAGTPCELHVYPGCLHGFDAFRGVAVSEAGRRAILEALRRSLYPSGLSDR